MALGDILNLKELKIATAESCTGGRIADKITNVPGASKYYMGGIVSYSNEAKISILGVREETIEKYGAVSAECARDMAMGAAKLFGADIAVATTGIAGPGGGTEEKPVGTVFIAYYIFGRVDVEKRLFSGSREDIKRKIVEHALEVLKVMLDRREF